MIGGKTAAATVFVDVEGDLTKFRNDIRGAADVTKKELGGALGRQTKLAGGALATASAGVFAGAAKTFVDFEKGISEVYTLLPDASAALKDQLSADAKSIATEFGQEFGTVTTAMYDSISAGVDPEAIEGFLGDAGKLAIAGATDIGTAVDGLTGVLNAYGYDAGEAARISDVMFGTVKAGKTTVDELASKVANVTPIAANLGLSFEQVGAAFATVTATTGNTAEASTQLRAVLAELSKDGSVAFKAFEEASGQTFPDFIAAGGNLSDGLLDMQTYAEANDKSLSDMFGSVEAGGAALILAKDGAQTFNDNLDALNASAGSTDEAFGTMSETLSFQFAQIKAELAGALLEIGVAIAPTLAQLAEGFAAFAGVLGDIPGPVLTLIVGLTGLAGALLFLAGPILKATTLIKGIFTLLTANPYIILIAATIAIAVLIYKNWDEISAFLSAAWAKIQAAASAVWTAIQAVIGTVGGVISGYFQTFYIQPVEWLIGLFQSVPAIASAAWNGIKDAVISVKDTIIGAVDDIAAAVDKALGPIDEIIGKAGKIGGGLLGAGASLLGFDDGGVVPGPRGAPRLVLAHGGETFVPTHKDPNALAGLGGGITVKGPLIGTATIASDYDIDTIARELDRRLDRERRAQGGRR